MDNEPDDQRHPHRRPPRLEGHGRPNRQHDHAAAGRKTIWRRSRKVVWKPKRIAASFARRGWSPSALTAPTAADLTASPTRTEPEIGRTSSWESVVRVQKYMVD